MKAVIALEDGKIFSGTLFGYPDALRATGEVVFNTSMTGYQEILTDPSYKGQIVTMTYPHIGNYGINSEDMEGTKPHVAGFVVKEYSKIYSNWRADKSLGEFLKENKIVGIEDVDTRALVKHIREKGSMKGIIFPVKTGIRFDKESLLRKLKHTPGIIGQDLVKEVTCKKIQEYPTSLRPYVPASLAVVVLDFGVKLNILRSLVNIGLNPVVVPAKTSFEKILSLKPRGILLSNGPGDPEGIPYAIETVKKLISNLQSPISNLPLFGICLGHQILALAFGGKTYKLKFGHHGSNQPIKNLKTGRVAIASENHNFAVNENSVKDFTPTFKNLNDGTLEGMEHKTLPVFSVQFHPEASPGPHDTKYLFEKFADMIKKTNRVTNKFKKKKDLKSY